MTNGSTWYKISIKQGVYQQANDISNLWECPPPTKKKTTLVRASFASKLAEHWNLAMGTCSSPFKYSG